MQCKTNFAASQRQLEAWKRIGQDQQRKMERLSLVFSKPGRTFYMPDNLQPVDELLRQQHAVREPDRPQEYGILDITERRDIRAGGEIPSRIRNPFARTWRFLLSWVCELLVKAAEKVSQPPPLRIYPQRKTLFNRQATNQLKRGSLLDSVE